MSPDDPRRKACFEAIKAANAYVVRMRCYYAPGRQRGSYADLVRARMESRAAMAESDHVHGLRGRS